MTCREFIEFLMQYVSEELPESQRARFVDHLAICPSCVAYMHSYLETMRLEKNALTDPDAELPEDVPEDLVRAILAAKRQKE